MTKWISEEAVFDAMHDEDRIKYERNARLIDDAENTLYWAKKRNRDLRAKWRRKMRRADARS